MSPVAGLFIVGVGYGRLRRRIAERQQQRLAEAVQLAEERMSGIRTVRTFNAETRELQGFERLLDLVYVAGRHNAIAVAGLNSFFVTGGGLFLLHIIYNCGMMVTSGAIRVGTTVSLAMYCGMAGASYTGIMTAYGDIQKCLGACQKVLEILKAADKDRPMTVQPELTKAIQDGVVPPATTHPLAVSFEGVSFAYPGRSEMPVLRGLDLDIPAGSRVALLGRSGSGKSTVATLLAGLYPPDAGRVLADGRDITSEPGASAWVRSQIGVISQEPIMFALSIRDNIAYGLHRPHDDASHLHDTAEATIKEAMALAHVDEFVWALPQGLDTMAGERGQALSGGQKQRVCIARALARKPRMLIFDEATSALDLRSERLVLTALQQVLSDGNCTCLVITHRHSALAWVDRVAVMHEGRVVQYGPKDEVLASPCPALQSIFRSNDGTLAAVD